MTISNILQSQRRVLLDLTYRNRLLSLPKRPSARSIIVYDEISAEVAGWLLARKSMSFTALPAGSLEEETSSAGAGEDEDAIVLPQPDDEFEIDGTASRHRDNKLQTKIKSEHLQKRLLEIYYESRMMLEEQGVNVLFLALGQLKFRERLGSAEFRHAPIVLLPVVLERKSARERFQLKWTEEDPQENLSLREKLRSEFGVVLPEFSEADEFDVASYLQGIREAIASQEGWEVIDNAIQLGFFSFAKLLMFLDLDPANWPTDAAIDQNELVGGLLGDGFAERDVGIPPPSPGFLDALIPATESKHVVDCDSSQSLAIETIRRGQNLVIQGPPGTGKSQTIANLIAAAVGDGKRVLFVAEKMAALEVVKRRLAQVGLGPMCLELHSNKANKRAVLEELDRTLSIGRPEKVDVSSSISKLEDLRGRLNHHAAIMHAPIGAAELTPYRILGELSCLIPRVGRPPYGLPASGKWSPSDLEVMAAILRELLEFRRAVGDPACSPWRGVAHPPVMRPRAEDMVAAAKPLAQSAAALEPVAQALGAALDLSAAASMADLERQCTIAERLAAAPEFDRATIGSGVWLAGIESLREAVRNGKLLSEVRARRRTNVRHVAWDTDWTNQRMLIAGHGRSLFRWLNGSYRHAINQLHSVTGPSLPKAFDGRLLLLDDLIAGHKASEALKSASTTARAAFGSVWNGESTDWELAQSILDWVEKQSMPIGDIDLRQLASVIDGRRLLPQLAKAARDAIAAVRGAMVALSSELKMDIVKALDGAPLDEIDFEQLLKRAEACARETDSLMAWLAYAEVVRRAEALGLQAVLAALTTEPAENTRVVDTFLTAFYLERLKEATEVYPDLARFDGRRHEDLIKQFRQWDRERMQIARIEIAASHHASIPKSVVGAGALGTLRAEIARKRGHMALRKLLRICGSPIQAAKPVFMMSPLSVAQFLEPGAIEFDLLVIDEASQVEPVDALGAIARCHQVVVVGDDKQLPPTSFFSRVVSGDEENGEDEGAQAKDLESILSLCAAKGLPQRMLRWHYRSRHESLIAVSNKEFYDGELYIVPSPDRERSDTGLRFHHLPHGRFDRGNTYKNSVEAAAIARAVIAHARERPHLTLGVGAMSVRQRQAISDEIELARRQNPELEQFVARHPNEPFFVKNLENIQGDERDVILISIGYGRAKNDDKMYQNFGPLNSDGGHRRLNVLISRARERCEVFSSITADDIRVDERSKHGVIALKTFLKYAEQGDLGIPSLTGRGVDSPFEEAVHEALSRHGFEVQNQVGVAGFFIDLAVVDPERPGRYLAGIECDGATYHSAPSARDRDRLRQEILEAHGWTICRVWSTDWFQRPQAELDRLLNAIRLARTQGLESNHGAIGSAIVPRTEIAFARERIASDPHLRPPSHPYIQANFSPDNLQMAPHLVPIASMAYTVERIVEIEGPIHEEELVARVRDLWSLGRAGNRIQTAVQDALRHAMARGRLATEDNCYQIKGSPVLIRDRTAAASRTLRRPELLPSQEIREAALVLTREAHGARREEIVTVVSRWLGFAATSQQLRDRINSQIDQLLGRGTLAEEDDLLVAAEASPN